MASLSTETQEPLQERLKDQVSVSIKEALDRANTVLTNLHRVQSYLDVIRILSTPRSGDVIKNALEQIHAARNDTATLLQHIYLTEIGLQSLQDYSNGGGLMGVSSSGAVATTTTPSSSSGAVSSSSANNTLSSLMPILGATINSSAVSSAVAHAVIDGVHESMMEGLGSQELDFTSSSAVEETEGQPPPKKMKQDIIVSNCVACNRKFATQSSSEYAHLCRNCRSTGSASMTGSAASPSTGKSPSSLKFPPNNNSQKSLLTSTPKLSKSGGIPGSGGKQTSSGGNSIGSGRNLVPMRCKLCNTCFRYRRCLFRHLRENHPGIDQDNLMQYIDMDASATGGQQSSTPVQKGAISGGKQAMPLQRGHQEVDASATSSLHVTIGSEVGDLSDSVTASILGGDGNEGTENGAHTVLLVNQGGLAVAHSEPSSEEEEEEEEEEEVGEGGGGGMGDAADKTTPQGALQEGVAKDMQSAMQAKLLGKYNCNVCNKSFDRPYRLQRHLQIHNPNRPRVQCQFCDRSFTRLDTLENHVKCLHSNERPYKCTFEGCTKTFPLNSALVHHLKTHMGGKPYQCNECDFSFALFGEFKVHMNEAHSYTKDRRCAYCFKLFDTNEELEKHYSHEHRYECEICGKSFARLGYLQAHIEIHNGVSLFNCRQCNAGFDSEYSYKQHIKTHPNYNKAKRVYPCQICGKTFYDSRKMIMHSHTDEHQEKAKSLGLPAGVVLQNLSEETDVDVDVDADVSVLMNEVANSMQASGSTPTQSVDDNLIQSIVESEAFKAAAASVGVAAEAAAAKTNMNTSSEGSTTSSSSSSSSMLNSGGGIPPTAALLSSTAGETVGVGVQRSSSATTSEQ